MRLTIYIPTIARAELPNLLASIPPHPDVEVIVSDNSGGNAAALCADFPHVIYERRRYDVGGDLNLLRAWTVGTGDWVWMIGDDDELLPGALDLVCDALLKDTRPLTEGIDRLIVLTPESVDWVPLTDWGPHFTSELIELLRPNTSLLVAATLCSANVFRRGFIDPSRGLGEHVDSHYGWLHPTVGAQTTRVLQTPVFRCGYGYVWQMDNGAEVWQEYLDALCEAVNAEPVSVHDSANWNFAMLARRAAKTAAVVG